MENYMEIFNIFQDYLIILKGVKCNLMELRQLLKRFDLEMNQSILVNEQEIYQIIENFNVINNIYKYIKVLFLNLGFILINGTNEDAEILVKVTENLRKCITQFKKTGHFNQSNFDKMYTAFIKKALEELKINELEFYKDRMILQNGIIKMLIDLGADEMCRDTVIEEIFKELQLFLTINKTDDDLISNQNIFNYIYILRESLLLLFQSGAYLTKNELIQKIKTTLTEIKDLNISFGINFKIREIMVMIGLYPPSSPIQFQIINRQ